MHPSINNRADLLSGGKSGIGLYTAQKFVHHISSLTVYLVGHNGIQMAIFHEGFALNSSEGHDVLTLMN